MNKSIVFLIIVSFAMVIYSCSYPYTEKVKSEVHYNEIYNKVAQCHGNTYYIKENHLWQDINMPQVVSESTYTVQTYNDMLYYSAKIDEETWLMRYDGNNSAKISKLPNGRLKEITIYNDTIYVLMDYKLLTKKFGEEEFSVMESQIIDFMIHDGKIYYVSGEVSGLEESNKTFETYKSDFSQIDILVRLVSVDITTNKKTIIEENDSGFLMAPVNEGIVYYDSARTVLYQYKNNRSNALEKVLVTNMISYDDNIIYTAFDKNAVYSLSLSDGSNQKIVEGLKRIVGIVDGYLYTYEGEWLNVDVIKFTDG